MQKIVPLLVLILSFSLFAQDEDGYIELEFHGDSLIIRHIGAWRNCGAKYAMDIELIDSTIYLMENDTSAEWARCMCYFDLSVTINTPPAGKYSLIIFTTNIFQGDTAFVADTSFIIGNVPLISFSNPGCMTNFKQDNDIAIPLTDHYESDCQETVTPSLYASTYDNNLQVVWHTDSINCNVAPLWSAILSDDTLTITMTDTGAVSDCFCPKYLTAGFGPLPPGKYTLNFRNGELGFPVFIIEEQVTVTTEDNDLILSWDIAELNCCLATKWEGWLEGNIFHVTMKDTGAPCDCICPFELSARFGPFEPGNYTLNFHNTNLGLFDFTIGGNKKNTDLTVLASYQSECYGAVKTEARADIPAEFALLACYPNPFNPTATIAYYLPEQTDILLRVFDINGRQIQTLFAGPRDRGAYTFHWNAADYPSGIYFVALKGKNISIRKKMLLLK